MQILPVRQTIVYIPNHQYEALLCCRKGATLEGKKPCREQVLNEIRFLKGLTALWSRHFLSNKTILIVQEGISHSSPVWAKGYLNALVRETLNICCQQIIQHSRLGGNNVFEQLK
jgi:hypothetical protein